MLRPVLFAVALVCALPAAAQTIAVESRAALLDALRSAPAGATLALAPGDYGALEIAGPIRPAVIRSADPGDPARIARLVMRDVSDLRMEGLVFDYDYAEGDELWHRHFQFFDVTGLTLAGNRFEGDVARGRGPVDDGFGFGFGLAIRGGQDVRVESNEIRDFYKGFHFRDIDGLSVVRNRVHRIRMDGMNFAQVRDVLVEANHIHDFNRSMESKDHADMIQFWTNKTDWSSRDIVIRGNVLNSGDGWFTQSIFMRNERSDRIGGADPSLYYRNILIEENVVINAHAHGITVGDATGVTVRRNTLIQNEKSAWGDPATWRYIPHIRVNPVSRDVTVEDNIAGRVAGYEGQPGWRVADNLAIQNRGRMEPGHYSRVFANAGGGDPARLDTWRIARGGPADRAGLGASLIRP